MRQHCIYWNTYFLIFQKYDKNPGYDFELSVKKNCTSSLKDLEIDVQEQSTAGLDDKTNKFSQDPKGIS